MVILRLLRFLRGTVTFLIMGAFPEKLLNRCARERIPVWDAAPTKGGISARTYAGHYRRTAMLARKESLRTRVTVRRGLRFHARPILKRKGLLLGAVCGCALIWALTGRLWTIDISGCETIDENALRGELSSRGLFCGAKLREIDARSLAREMLLTDDRISWITVNLRGSTAEVLLSECAPPPETIDPADKWANVVAAEDGVIHSVLPFKGQALCRKGDTVSKGEILVSGVMEDEFGGSMLTYARASVLAGVYEKVTVTVPYRERIVTEAPEPLRSRGLSCFGRELVAADVPREALRTERTVRTILYPFLTIEEAASYLPQTKTVERTPFAAKEEAMRRLRAMRAEEEGTVLLGEELTVEEGETALRLHALQYVEKDIAEIREFSVERRQENESVL